MTENPISPPSAKPLHRMFTVVPRTYDLVNRVITLGMDREWRRKGALACLSDHPERFLDLCCGTGDLAILVSKLAGYSLKITGADYSQPMLDIAAGKAQVQARENNIAFVNAEVSSLPFPRNHFDCVGTSFAFRNITYKNPLANLHIKEVISVLKPGGKYVIIESSQPAVGFIRFFFHLYLRFFVFPAGLVISGNKTAYRYLADSISNFFSAEEANQYLLDAGFREVSFQRLFFGAAAIHVAVK